MTVPEIIEALTPAAEFPRTALEEAVAQPEAITPHLLRALEEAAENPALFKKGKFIHVYAAYLLAQFREKRAYRLLMKVVGQRGEIAHELFGDTVTEDLNRILASVYDGDLEPLKRLVEDDKVDEFVRGAAVETFAILVHTGQVPRETVVEYYRELFGGKLTRERNQVWNALAGSTADLPAAELLPELRQACEEEVVDPRYVDFERLQEDIIIPFEHKEPWKREHSTLITDVIDTMESWACFRSEESQLESEDSEFDDLDLAPAERVIPIRTEPKIGRNDPCPCGSGKKYKKCCLGKTEA